jgi:signal transduction histidine kinase
VGAALLAGVVVVIAGGTLAWQFERQDRAEVDSALVDRADRISADIGKMLTGAEDGHANESTDPYGDLLGGSESLVRLLVDGELVAQRGELPATDAPIPHDMGFSTIQIDGSPWRSLVQESAGAQLQVLQSLAPVEDRRTRNLWLVAWVTAAATLLGALGGWFVAVRVLRPLERLRAAAVNLRDERDSERLPVVRAPAEVADLSSTLNAMLDRLRSSTNAARRFTADAGHELRNPLTSIGAYLESLERLPAGDDAHRDELVIAMREEYTRIVSLLDGLQALARGDAGVLPAREDFDVADVVEDAVAQARRRHPDVQYNTSVDEAIVSGWRDGFRGAIDNLLQNAALHGRPAGQVLVDVRARAERVKVTVSDDGPGIPPERREDMLRRFVRGERTRADGSGLGLALVAQQAELHGGEVTLGDAASGGLAVTLDLPVARST